MRGSSKQTSSNRSFLVILGISAAAVIVGGVYSSALKGSVTGYGTRAVIVANQSVRKGTDLTYAVQATYGSVSQRPVLIYNSIRIPWGFTLKNKPGNCNQNGDAVVCVPSATPVDNGSDYYMITFNTKNAACNQDAINWTTIKITDSNTQQTSTTVSDRVHTLITCN